MKSYRVSWEIDIDADSPREAAEKSRAIIEDPESIGHVFAVYVEGEDDYDLIDLDAPEGDE